VKNAGVGRLLRLTIAASLISYLFWLANPREVWITCARASWPPLLIAVSLVLFDRALMAYRWFVLVRPLEVGVKPRTILRVFFVSSFIGTFLPGSVGGDAVRAYSLSTHGVPLSDSMAAVFLDRMLGVMSVLLMAIVGLAFARDLASDQTVLIGLGLTALACAIATALVFSDAAEAVAERLLARLPWARGRRSLGLVLSATRRYARYHHVVVLVLAGSIAVQVLRTVQAFYLGRAIDIQQPPSTYVAFVPLILLIMLLPVTVNGIGTSQAAFMGCSAVLARREPRPLRCRCCLSHSGSSEIFQARFFFLQVLARPLQLGEMQ
jgi:uncharacterized protein (TIRG00374 family)